MPTFLQDPNFKNPALLRRTDYENTAEFEDWMMDFLQDEWTIVGEYISAYEEGRLFFVVNSCFGVNGSIVCLSFPRLS